MRRWSYALPVALFVLTVTSCEREPAPAPAWGLEAPPSAEPALSPSPGPLPMPAPEPQPPVAAADPQARSVILVTIDGVRWEDVFRGAPIASLARPFALMPKTKALVDERGLALGGGGDGCGVVRPDNPVFLSLPGYLEILSGRTTDCAANRCRRVGTSTLLDHAALDSEARGLGPVASIGSWPELARAASSGRGPVLVSEGRLPWPGRPIDDPALEAAVAASEEEADPTPGGGLYRRDEHTSKIALAYLRAERPRLLHVGLGDTDEHGHEDDFPAYALALRMADLFVADVAQAVDELDLRAAVVVTTDHGRSETFRDHGSAFPASGRSFVLAFGDGVARRGVLCDHRDATLPDVGATVRELLELPADEHADAGEPIAEVLL